MKKSKFFRFLGIIPNDERKILVEHVKIKYGPLPYHNVDWNDNLLEKTAKEILKSKIGEPAVDALIEQIKQNQCLYLNGWSKYTANFLIDVLRKICERDFENDWILDAEKCCNRLIELLDDHKMNPDEVINKILENISLEPHIYLIPTEIGAKKIAEMLYKNIEPELLKATPPHFTIQGHRILLTIEELAMKRIPLDKIVIELTEKIKINPLWYICPPSPPSVDYAMR